jgi:preprotein translocase subunit SecY
LAVPFGFLQGYAMLNLFQQRGLIESLSFELMIVSLLTITAGTVFLMWLGELISEKGIGNGVSLLIFAGIVSDLPNNVRQAISTWDPAKAPAYLFFFATSLLIIAGVVLINEGRRNIPVSYAKRVRGNKVYGGASTYLPLNINPAGVIPIIFALSIMLFPGMIANFLGGAEGLVGNIAQGVGRAFENIWFYSAIYFILVVLFTYFYTAVTFDPKAIATNLQKMGGFIPGIRPGESTSNFMLFILNRVLLVGALFLGAIAIMPTIIGKLTGIMVFQFFIGGTALLIAVSVVLDIMRQVKAQLEMREYESF